MKWRIRHGQDEEIFFNRIVVLWYPLDSTDKFNLRFLKRSDVSEITYYYEKLHYSKNIERLRHYSTTRN